MKIEVGGIRVGHAAAGCREMGVLGSRNGGRHQWTSSEHLLGSL